MFCLMFNWWQKQKQWKQSKLYHQRALSCFACSLVCLFSHFNFTLYQTLPKFQPDLLFMMFRCQAYQNERDHVSADWYFINVTFGSSWNFDIKSLQFSSQYCFVQHVSNIWTLMILTFDDHARTSRHLQLLHLIIHCSKVKAIW